MTEQSPRSLNTDMDTSSVEFGDQPASYTFHTAIVQAFAAKNKAQAAEAKLKLQEHQGMCLEIIHTLGGYQYSSIDNEKLTNSEVQRDYCELIEYVVGIGLSCEAVINQMDCSKTIYDNP